MGNCDFSLPALPTNNKTPGRACYSTRCFVVCPNSVPIKNRVFGLYFNGGGEENRTPVRKPLRATFFGRSPAFFIPGGGGAGRRVPLGIPLIYDGFKGNGPFTFTAS